MEQNNNILQELKESIKEFEFENIRSIHEGIRQMNEECYIIFNEWGGITSITDSSAYYISFRSTENTKFLLIPKKMFEKLKNHIDFLKNFGNKEAMIDIGKSLNKLYPDFNFFDL
jgi:hypothetical protein